jgi:drug/metabolite transporter (DMT)-like permease
MTSVPTTLTSDEIRGHLAMLAFSALVAGSFSLGAIVANDIDPQAITAARFAFATIVMGMVAWLQGSIRLSHFAAPWRFFVLGGLFTIYFVLMFEGLKTANPVSAAAVFTLMPLMSAVFGFLLLRQITTRRMALALGIAAFGALWVIFRGDPAAFVALEIGRGEVIYFIGCIAHAFYTPMVRFLNRGEGAAVFTFGMLAAGTVLLGAVSFDKIVATDWMALPLIIWITIGYLTLFSTASSFFMLQYATLRLPSAKVMAYSYLTPAWVILWEIGFGSLLPPAHVLLGIGATIVALLLLLRNDAQERPRIGGNE